MGTTQHRWRHWASDALVVVTGLALAVAVLAGWAERTLFHTEEFADRAVRTLDSEAVRHAIAVELGDAVSAAGPASVASFRSVLVPMLEDIEMTPGFHQLFRAAVEDAHDAVFQRHAGNALLELAGTLEILTSTAQTGNPGLAAQLPKDVSSLLIDVSPVLAHLRPWRWAEPVRWLDDVAWAVAIGAAAGAVALARRRRRAVAGVGLAVTIAGVVVATVAVVAARAAGADVADPALAGAARAAVDRFTADLRATGLWMVPIGIVVVAAATATGPLDLRALTAGAAARWRTPSSRMGSIGRGLLLVALAVGVVAARDVVVPVLVLVAAALAGYAGLVLVLAGVLGPVAAQTTDTRDSGDTGHTGDTPDTTATADTRERRPSRRRSLAVVGAAGVLVVALVAVLAVDVTTRRNRARAGGRQLVCNGHAELCDRRLDQVVFAGAHNAMSAASDPGWFFPQNVTGIPDQLRYGVRALLVKSHYGIPTGLSVGGTELVVTDKAAEIANNAAAETEELSPEAVARAQQLEPTVPDDRSARGVYLCHVYCTLGATPMSRTLGDIKAFLDRNPGEVIMLFIGDFVSPADTEAEFARAGLTDRLWTYDTSAPPPTLRQMIKARRNLLVLSEHAGGTPPWYTTGYGIFQDTPFTFAQPSDFSCAPNRGPPDAPLFQINHWITNTSPPSAELGRQVNAYDALMSAVQTCIAQRGRTPTIVGVNFYDQGDLRRVVDELNGVS